MNGFGKWWSRRAMVSLIDIEWEIRGQKKKKSEGMSDTSRLMVVSYNCVVCVSTHMEGMEGIKNKRKLDFTLKKSKTFTMLTKNKRNLTKHKKVFWVSYQWDLQCYAMSGKSVSERTNRLVRDITYEWLSIPFIITKDCL